MSAMCTAMLSMPPVTVGFPVTRVTPCGHPEISYSPLSLCRSPRALGRALVTKQGSGGATVVPIVSSPVSCPRPLPGPCASVPSPPRTRPARLRGRSPQALCAHHSALSQAARLHATYRSSRGVTLLLPPSPVRMWGTLGGETGQEQSPKEVRPPSHRPHVSCVHSRGSRLRRSQGRVSVQSKSRDGGSVGRRPAPSAGAPGCQARRHGMSLQDTLSSHMK